MPILDTVNQKVRPRLLTGLTALGSSQTTAFPLVNDGFHEFTTVASSTGCILPVPFPSPPSTVTIVNAGANALDVYPQLGGTIAGGAVNAAVSLAAGSSVTYGASSLTNWYALQTTPSGSGTPGGSNGQIQYDASGSFGGFTASGDATINTSTGAVTVTRTSGTAFAASATTDTTVASNISSGTLAAGRLPALTGAVVTTAGSAATTFGTISTHNVLANTTSGTAAPAGVTLTSVIDAAIASTQGDVLYRGSSAWGALAPGTANNPLQTGGSAANPSWNANLLLPSAGPTRYTTGPIFSITGPGTAVANTTTATSVFAGATMNGSLTIPANTLSAGQALRVWLSGTWSCTSSSPTIQMLVYLGGTIIAQSTASGVPASAVSGLSWFTGQGGIVVTFPAIGTGGQSLTSGGLDLFTGAGTVTGWYVYNGTSASGTPTAINTTGSLALDVQFRWGTASASNTIQLLSGYGEIIG